jgi:hypothetical protein
MLGLITIGMEICFEFDVNLPIVVATNLVNSIIILAASGYFGAKQR